MNSHSSSSSPSSSLCTLSAAALTERLTELLLRERECVLEFVFLLAELQRRGTHVGLGYDSLFTYCRKALGLSKAYAYRRATAAELLVRFPEIAEFLADGRLCLSTLVPLKKVLMEASDPVALLNRAAGKTEEEVELLVVTLQPRPEVRDVIRLVPARVTSVVFGPEARDVIQRVPERETTVGSGPELAASLPATQPSSPSPLLSAPSKPARFELLNPETVRIALSVAPDFRDRLEEVRAALSHVIPDGNLEDVLRECFRITLDACMRRRVGAKGVVPDEEGPGVADGSSRNVEAEAVAVAGITPSIASRAIADGSSREVEAEAAAVPGITPSIASRAIEDGSSRKVEAEAVAVAGITPSIASRAIADGSSRKIEAEAEAVAVAGVARSIASRAIADGSSRKVVAEAAKDAGGRPSDAGALEVEEVGSGPEPTGAVDEVARYIPTGVRAAVWKRDEGACTYTGPDGHRCRSTHQLEFHHRKAVAFGGRSTPENVTLHCRRHNLHQARLDFGDAHMDQFA